MCVSVLFGGYWARSGERMRASAIFGLGSTTRDLEPFQDGSAVAWHIIGLPVSGGEADAVVIFGGDGTLLAARNRQLRSSARGLAAILHRQNRFHAAGIFHNEPVLAPPIALLTSLLRKSSEAGICLNLISPTKWSDFS